MKKPTKIIQGDAHRYAFIVEWISSLMGCLIAKAKSEYVWPSGSKTPWSTNIWSDSSAISTDRDSVPFRLLPNVSRSTQQPPAIESDAITVKINLRFNDIIHSPVSKLGRPNKYTSEVMI